MKYDVVAGRMGIIMAKVMSGYSGDEKDMASQVLTYCPARSNTTFFGVFCSGLLCQA